MADFYFFKTMADKSRNRLRPLSGQFLDGVPVDITLNVQSDAVLRTTYPLGTIFGSRELKLNSGYYTSGDIFPVSLRDDEYKEFTHRPSEAMKRAYESFTGLSDMAVSSSDDAKHTSDGVDTKTVLGKLMSNDKFAIASVEKDGFFVDPKIWFLLLRNINNQVNTLMIGDTGTGKCLGVNTPILMFDGSIKMVQDIKIGDKIMGPDSSCRNILSVTTGKEEMFRITPIKGDSWVCNRSHILSLKRTNDGRHFGEICNVSVEDYLKWSPRKKHLYKQWRTSIEYPEKSILLDPYFLGLWLGDGRTDSPTICTPDEPIVSYLTEYAASLNCSLSVYEEPSKANSYGIVSRIRNNKRSVIQQLMDKYDLFGNKHIPTDFLINSRDNRLKLFAGLMDSDGCKSTGVYEYCTVLDSLKNDIVYLSRSLGFYVHVSTKVVKGKNYWRLTISGDFSNVPTRIERKNIACRTQKKNVLVTGFSVESLGEGTYYGFTIDGDHLFCLGDFTVTHNTELVMLACKKLGIPCSVYDMGSMYDPVAGLLGVHRLQQGGVSTFDYAKFTQDISKPGVVLLDELSRAPVTTNNILFPCLDSRKTLPVEIAGGDDLRSVPVHPECTFVATANIGAEYSGTMSLDRALVGRFFPIELDYMPDSYEIDVIVKRCRISSIYAKHIVHVAKGIRSIFRKKEISVCVSTRETLMAGELVADGWSVLQAMEMVFLPLFEGTDSDGERGIIRKIIMSK